MYNQGNFGNSVNMAGSVWQHRIGVVAHWGITDVLKHLKEAAELMGW